MREKVLVLDFGSQYTQLIARRTRELGVYSEIKPYNTSADEIRKDPPGAIILSGGPSSVWEDVSPRVAEGILPLGVPVLGICYGLQVLVFQLGGEVERSDKREYGPAVLNLVTEDPLFSGVAKTSGVWMVPRRQGLGGARGVCGDSRYREYGVRGDQERKRRHPTECSSILKSCIRNSEPRFFPTSFSG